jgi:hypothetical protein
MARLEPNQVLVSGLYYVKWLQYAALVFVLPGLLDGAESNSLVRSLRRVLGLAIAASALLAAYEVAESIGTGSFAAAARFPRASAFFGTLDPAKFGASEDPVNFGCFLVVAGAIALSLANRGGSRRTFGPALTVAGAVVGVLLSVSRAPLLAGAVALAYVQRWRPGRVVLTGAAVTLAAVGGLLLFPDVGAILGARVEAIADPASALESSAAGRMAAIVGAPVFDPDAFWLAGHGHSSYRFAVEPHSSQFGASVSRSLYSFPLAAWYDAGAAGLVLWVLVFVQFNRRFAALAGESVRTPGGRGGHPVVRPTADAIDSHGSRMPAADSDVRSLARGMRGALWGLAVAALFAEVPYHWRVMGVFYICAGICLSAGWNLRMGDRQPRGETP